MRTLNEREYKELKFFRNLDVIEPTSGLIRYRKYLYLTSSFVCFYLLAGLKFKSLNTGLVSGEIVNPEVVIYFLIAVFLYSFSLYTSQFLYEYYATVAKSNSISIDRYGMEVSAYLMAKDLSNFPAGGRITTSMIKTGALTENELGTGYISSYQQDDDLGIERLEHYNKKDGYSSRGNKLIFTYYLANADKEFYQRNYYSLMNLRFSEFLQYVFPVAFSILVFVLLFYDLVAYLFGKPPISALLNSWLGSISL